MANGILRKMQTKKELAEYLSAACFNPSPSSFLQAIITKHFMSWPGLIVNLINKCLPKSIATAKGYLDQEFKNLQSIKEPPKDEHMEPIQVKDSVSAHDNLYAVFDTKEFASKTYSDQTERFPVK